MRQVARLELGLGEFVGRPNPDFGDSTTVTPTPSRTMWDAA